MKKFWEAQAQRIDALSLRERVIMFVSVALALVALADHVIHLENGRLADES